MIANSEIPERDDEFARLIASHRKQLLHFLTSMTACRSTADDLVQETCVRLWEKRAEFEPGSNFKAWAFQIGVNLLRNHRRKVSKGGEQVLPSEDLLERMQQRYQEREPRWQAESEHVSACLQQLPDRQRILMVRRYVGKVSVAALAEEWNLNPNALSQQLFRIKKALRRCVESRLRQAEEGGR